MSSGWWGLRLRPGDMVSLGQLFLSGGRAERSARALARLLARAGKAVRLVIEDRASRIVSQELFEPA